MTRERYPIRYPEDGMRILDIITDMTLRNDNFAAHVHGAEMHATERYIDRDESGAIIEEGFIVEAVFSLEHQSSQLRGGWGIANESLLVPA